MLQDLRTNQIPKQEIGFCLVEENGTRHPLRTINTIGRADDSDIVVDDPYISSKHALITKKGRRLIMQDLHSTNGSFINGKKIKKPTILKEEDEINLGSKKFALVRSEALGFRDPDYL